MMRQGSRIAVLSGWLCVLLFSTGCGSSADEPVRGAGDEAKGFSLRVMTFNILFAVPNPEYDPWEVRKDHVAAIIAEHDPDLIGFQEPFPWQVRDMEALCPGYESALLCYFPDSTIFYKEERFAVVEEGHYWLSPTPDKPLSVGFGNGLPRMVIWTVLEERFAGRELLFVNTHFDNTSPFQEHAAPLFLERTWEAASAPRQTASQRSPSAAKGATALPVIAVGDFNSRPGSEAYGILVDGVSSEGKEEPFFLTDTYGLADEIVEYVWEEDPPSFDPAGRIDHIFVAQGEFEASRWIVDLYTYGGGRRASDHFAVIADLTLR